MTDIQTLSISGIEKSFRFTFNELHIETAAVEDYIGFNPGESPEPFPSIIREIMDAASRVVIPVGGFVLMDKVQIDRGKKQIIIDNFVFNTKNIVTRHMDKAEKIAVFACTAGPEITAIASEYNRQGHTVHAYIADSIGSIVVERAMDIVAESLGVYMHMDGLKITNRYSPGYCGWPITEQEKVFSLLPPGYCGISLSESMLMKPIKSVSGFIGIGKQVLHDEYTCHYCRDVNCIYRGK